MAMDHVGGSGSVQTPADIGQKGVEEAGSVGKSFNRSVTVEADVQATEGLKSDKPSTEPPSIRERIITPLDSSKTRSIKQLAGQAVEKLADKVLPEKVKKGASSLKAKASEKARAAFEVVAEKATRLKSATIGKLLRMIRNESFSRIDSSVTGNPELQTKIEAHNKGVDRLADLKSQLKAEEKELKHFRSEFKEALELMEHPDKFISDPKPRTIAIPPDGDTRTILASDAATRTDIVDMIKADIKATSEYKNYEFKMSQKAAGGTDLYRARQDLKKEMKERAEDMVEMFRKEVAESLAVEMQEVESEKEDLSYEYSQQLTMHEMLYEKRIEEARIEMESRQQSEVAMKKEHLLTREVLQEDREAKRNLKKDAAQLQSLAARLSDKALKANTEQAASDAQNQYDGIKSRVGKMKQDLKKMPDELKAESKVRKEAERKFEKLESGKTLEAELKDFSSALEERSETLEKKERQLEKQAKEKISDFKKGLGR